MASSIILTAKNFVRFLRPGGTPLVYNSPNPPLFQRPSPWWAKWSWGLVACDIFMTGSAMDLTWKHWSKPVDGKSDSKDPLDYNLRPTWQRLGLCLGFFTGGVAAASALFIAAFRYTKVLDVFPPLAATLTQPSGKSAAAQAARKALEQRRVFIQSARNSRSRGITFPLSQCTLHRGRADSELLLTVDKERGHWYIGLDDDSIIDGKKYTGSAAREVILKAWKGGWIDEDLDRASQPFIQPVVRGR